MLCILRLIILFLGFLFYLAVLSFLFIFLTSNISCSIGSVFDVSVSCIANDDFNEFRPFLIFSNNPGVDVDVNVDNYLCSTQLHVKYTLITTIHFSVIGTDIGER